MMQEIYKKSKTAIALPGTKAGYFPGRESEGDRAGVARAMPGCAGVCGICRTAGTDAGISDDAWNALCDHAYLVCERQSVCISSGSSSQKFVFNLVKK